MRPDYRFPPSIQATQDKLERILAVLERIADALDKIKDKK